MEEWGACETMREKKKRKKYKKKKNILIGSLSEREKKTKEKHFELKKIDQKRSQHWQGGKKIQAKAFQKILP